MRRTALTLIAVLRLLLMAARRPLIRPRPVRTARPQSLDGHAAADRVGGAQALQDAAVARRFVRRDLKGHGAHAAARLARDGEGAGALGQRAKPAALPVKHLDLTDMAVGIRIELDLGFGRTGSCTAGRHFDHPGRAANAERRGRRGDLQSPVLATRLATNAAVPTATLKVAALPAPPFWYTNASTTMRVLADKLNVV